MVELNFIFSGANFLANLVKSLPKATRFKNEIVPYSVKRSKILKRSRGFIALIRCNYFTIPPESYIALIGHEQKFSAPIKAATDAEYLSHITLANNTDSILKDIIINYGRGVLHATAVNTNGFFEALEHDHGKIRISDIHLDAKLSVLIWHHHVSCEEIKITHSTGRAKIIFSHEPAGLKVNHIPF